MKTYRIKKKLGLLLIITISLSIGILSINGVASPTKIRSSNKSGLVSYNYKINSSHLNPISIVNNLEFTNNLINVILKKQQYLLLKNINSTLNKIQNKSLFVKKTNLRAEKELYIKSNKRLSEEKIKITKIINIIKNHLYNYSHYLSINNLYIPNTSLFLNQKDNSIYNYSSIKNESYSINNHLPSLNDISFESEESTIGINNIYNVSKTLSESVFASNPSNISLITFNSFENTFENTTVNNINDNSKSTVKNYGAFTPTHIKYVVKASKIQKPGDIPTPKKKSKNNNTEFLMEVFIPISVAALTTIIAAVMYHTYIRKNKAIKNYSLDNNNPRTNRSGRNVTNEDRTIISSMSGEYDDNLASDLIAMSQAKTRYQEKLEYQANAVREKANLNNENWYSPQIKQPPTSTLDGEAQTTTSVHHETEYGDSTNLTYVKNKPKRNTNPLNDENPAANREREINLSASDESDTSEYRAFLNTLDAQRSYGDRQTDLFYSAYREIHILKKKLVNAHIQYLKDRDISQFNKTFLEIQKDSNHNIEVLNSTYAEIVNKKKSESPTSESLTSESLTSESSISESSTSESPINEDTFDLIKIRDEIQFGMLSSCNDAINHHYKTMNNIEDVINNIMKSSSSASDTTKLNNDLEKLRVLISIMY